MTPHLFITFNWCAFIDEFVLWFRCLLCKFQPKSDLFLGNALSIYGVRFLLLELFVVGNLMEEFFHDMWTEATNRPLFEMERMTLWTKNLNESVRKALKYGFQQLLKAVFNEEENYLFKNERFIKVSTYVTSWKLSRSVEQVSTSMHSKEAECTNSIHNLIMIEVPNCCSKLSEINELPSIFREKISWNFANILSKKVDHRTNFSR